MIQLFWVLRYALVSINSDGRYDSVGTSNIYKAEDVSEINNIDELNELEDDKKPKPVYTRENTNYEDYDTAKKGFYNLSGLTEEQLNDVIISEIDNGNVIMLHTQYAKNEHWVIVSSYNLDENGDIIYTTKPEYESRKYISGLGGVDPEEQHNDETPQKTDNLGEKATVDSSGWQWLNSDMTVRVFHP